VLLTGENGTGKDLLARVIHHGGPRRHRPFVSINCGAVPESLLESELFGIEDNVATGVRGRPGKFEQAHGGTLFLDEIGEMPQRHQVALLPVIQSREVTRVGGHRTIPVDVRIIAATNQDLRRLMEEKRFREDLFYRLNIISIEVPPLRERKSDIPALAQAFVQQFSARLGRPAPELPAEFMAVLMRSDWPGNVRELQNYIEKLLAMDPGPALKPDPLPRDLESQGRGIRLGGGRKLADAVREVERQLVRDALKAASGNQSRAARALGISEQAIRYKMRKYGLEGARQDMRAR
jgi:transcriptional regulator with PAS, ATPase and Fis domain